VVVIVIVGLLLIIAIRAFQGVIARAYKVTIQHDLREFVEMDEIYFTLLGQSLIYMTIIIIVTVGIILSPLIHDMVFQKDMERQHQAAQTLLSLARL
jgi:hypothetical protein